MSVTAGNTLLVWVFSGIHGAPGTLSDSVSDSFVNASYCQYSSNYGQTTKLFATYNAVGGSSVTFTGTGPSSASVVLIAVQFSGSNTRDGTIGSGCNEVALTNPWTFQATASAAYDYYVAGVVGYPSTGPTGPCSADAGSTVAGSQEAENAFYTCVAYQSFAPSGLHTLESTWSSVSGTYGWLSVGLALEAPPAPTGLTVGTVTTSAIPLSWTNPSGGPTNDTVYAYAGSSCSGIATVISLGGVGTSYTFGGASATTYSFKVQAWFPGTIGGAMSSCVSGTTLPLAPTNLEAVGTNVTQAVATWTASSGTISNYTLEYGTVYGTYGTHVSEGNVSDVTVNALAKNTTYYSIVVAWSTGGASAASNVAPFHTPAPIPAASKVYIPPILTATESSQTSAVASWSAPTNLTITNYTLEYGTVYGTYGTHVSEGTALHATVSGLSSNVTYWFVVVPWTSATVSTTASNVVPIVTAPYVYGAPVLTLAAATQTSFLASWSAPVNTTVTNYTFEYGTTYGTYGTRLSEGSALHVTVTGLATNQTYWAFVQPWTSPTAKSLASNVAGVVTLAFVPGRPVLTVYALNSTAFRASWSSGVNVTAANYTLDYGATYGSYPTHASEGSSTLHATVTGLASGSTYYALVIEWTAAGSQFASNIAPVVLVANVTPAAPTLLAVTGVTTTTVSLSWAAPPGGGIVNYTIEYTNGCAGTVHRASVGSSATTYTLTGQTTNRLLCFFVTAWNATGQSPPSNEVSAVTASFPAAPVGLTIVYVGSTTVSANWTDVSGVGKPFPQGITDNLWRVYSGGSCGSLVASYNTLAQSGMVGGLTPSTAYSMNVLTENATGNSPTSACKAFTTLGPASAPLAPTGLAGVANATAINWYWTPPISWSFDNESFGIGTSCSVLSWSDVGVVGFYISTGLSPDTTYCGEVIAWNLTLGSPADVASAKTATPSSGAGLGSPIVTAAALNTTEVTVSWLAPPGHIANYTLAYSRWPWLPIAYVSVGNHTIYNVSGLASGLTYYFEVWPWSSGTNEGPGSNLAPAQTDSVSGSSAPFPWGSLVAIETLGILGTLAFSFVVASLTAKRESRPAKNAAVVALSRTRPPQPQRPGEISRPPPRAGGGGYGGGYPPRR